MYEIVFCTSVYKIAERQAGESNAGGGVMDGTQTLVAKISGCKTLRIGLAAHAPNGTGQRSSNGDPRSPACGGRITIHNTVRRYHTSTGMPFTHLLSISGEAS